MTDIRERVAPLGRPWWSPFLAGAAAGLLAAVLLRRGTVPEERSNGRHDREEDARSRWRDAWDAALDGASGGIAAARQLVAAEAVELDADELQERVAGMACSTACRVRLLGTGIVEVVGSCASDEDARALLDALAAEPGVEVVVNRVWTPTSGGPDDDAG